MALTIDDADTFPYRQLTIRGNAEVAMFDDLTPEYATSAVRYFGEEMGTAWLGQLAGRSMGRISITPRWVGLLDFETSFPSALS